MYPELPHQPSFNFCFFVPVWCRCMVVAVDCTPWGFLSPRLPLPSASSLSLPHIPLMCTLLTLSSWGPLWASPFPLSVYSCSPLLPSPFSFSPPLTPSKVWASFSQAPPSSLYPLVINKAEVNNDLVAISLFPCVLIFFGWSRRCWLKGHIPLKCKYTLPNRAVRNLYLSTYPTCNIVWDCVLTPLLALANVHLFNCYLFNGKMSAFPWFLVKLNIFSYHYQTLMFILFWIAVWRHT